MISNLKVNIILGFITFLFTYLFSIVNNTWQTSLFRALLGFLLFFILGFIVLFILGLIGAKKQENSDDSLFKKGHLNEETVQKKNDEIELKSEPGFQSIGLDSLHNPGNGK